MTKKSSSKHDGTIKRITDSSLLSTCDYRNLQYNDENKSTTCSLKLIYKVYDQIVPFQKDVSFLFSVLVGNKYTKQVTNDLITVGKDMLALTKTSNWTVKLFNTSFGRFNLINLFMTNSDMPQLLFLGHSLTAVPSEFQHIANNNYVSGSHNTRNFLDGSHNQYFDALDCDHAPHVIGKMHPLPDDWKKLPQEIKDHVIRQYRQFWWHQVLASKTYFYKPQNPRTMIKKQIISLIDDQELSDRLVDEIVKAYNDYVAGYKFKRLKYSRVEDLSGFHDSSSYSINNPGIIPITLDHVMSWMIWDLHHAGMNNPLGLKNSDFRIFNMSSDDKDQIKQDDSVQQIWHYLASKLDK